MASCIAHTARHGRSFYGFWDGLRAVDYCAASLSYAPFLSSSQQDLAKRVSASTNRMHNAFSIPQTVFNAAVLTAVIREGLDKGMTSETGKKIAIAAMFTTNSLTQALLFLKQMEFVKLAGETVIDAIYNVTNVLMDAKDIYEMPEAKATPFMDFLKLVRSISSIASAALALGALVFVALQSEAIVIVSLALSVVWIATKITVKLMEEMDREPAYRLCQEKL